MAVKKPLFILSPMDDVTDSVFRRIVSKCAAPDLLFTEFVNVDGLQSPGRAKLLKKLYFTQEEVPLVVQLWGKHRIRIINYRNLKRDITRIFS